MQSRHNAAMLALLATVSFTAIAAGAADAATPRNIGTVAAANDDVLGTPPAQQPRKLKLGLKLVESERVETSPVGAGQFMFLDQTTLMVWPKSDIVLDKYIYDPDKGAGEMAMSATRGVLRFIGGKISKTSDVTVRTPHAIVAIRGGMAHIEISDEKTKVTNVAGEYVKITNENGEVTLSRPMAAAESDGGAPNFLGIGGPAEAAALYRLPLGVGDGGVEKPIDEPIVEEAALQSGLVKIGSGDQTAPKGQSISTRGERAPRRNEQGDEVVVEVEKTILETNRILIASAVVDPTPEVILAEKPAENSGSPGGGGSGGFVFSGGDVIPGGDPAIPELPGQEIAGFEGAMFQNLNASAAGDLMFGPASGGIRFLAASETEDGGVRQVLGGTELDLIITFDEIPGFNVLPGGGEIGGRVADVTSFVDPDVFLLQALSANDGGPDAFQLSFIGAPTPTDVWTETAAPDVVLRRFAVSDDLFGQDPAPLPPGLGEAFGDDRLGELLLIGDPAGPVSAPFDPAVGPGVDTASKWALGWLSIQGEGVEQAMALGAMTAEVLPTAAGQPSGSGVFQVFAKGDAGFAPGVGFLPFGTLDNLAGETAFGPNGDYFVFSNGGPYLADDDPAFDAAPGTFSEVDGSGEAVQTYGDTRLASLTSKETVANATRAPLGTDLTGGFAAGVGQAFTPGAADGAKLSAPYLLATATPDDVRFLFDPNENAVSAEFLAEAPDGAVPSGDLAVALNFGGRDGQSAFLSDNVFLAQDSATATGGVTGQEQSLAGSSGAAPTGDRQNAFRGVLVSSGAVGDGGIFPPDVNAQPEFLRWGWWAGEYRQASDDPNPDLQARTDRFMPGVWVAGVKSDIASVQAATGLAKFDGFALASVIEAGAASYVEGGTFGMQYDFSARFGIVQIDGIAGENLTSVVSEANAPAGHHYGGGFNGFQNVGAGSIRGAFFTGDGDATAATAGGFGFTATDAGGVRRDVSGVFGADRE